MRRPYTPARVMDAVNTAFLRIPKPQVRAIVSNQKRLSLKHGLSMFTPQGKPRIIDVHLRPWVLDRAQRKFFHQTCLVVRGALERVLPLYLARADVRKVVPLEQEEHQWVAAANAGRLQRPQTMIDRLDTTASFTIPDWRENFWFLEPNCVGIGGVHYIPATCALTGEWVLPALRRVVPGLRLQPQDDIRLMMLRRFSGHAKAIGRRLRRIALIEDQSEDGGTDEFTSLAKFYSRRGLKAITGDPREVAVRGGELTVRGTPVDLLYRDSEVPEILEMAGKRPQRVAGMREAFIRNQVVSSIAGEFDHKSIWELFTSPEFARHFTRTEKRVFRRHVLWTRLLWERKTTGPDGKPVDLVRFARRNREMLVVKPNRAYGGEGVVFGHQVTQARWEKELANALKRPYTHVIQRSAEVRGELFPVARQDGSVKLEPYYAVTGFAVYREGMAVLGRASREQVVNVSRRGGLIAIWKL